MHYNGTSYLYCYIARLYFKIAVNIPLPLPENSSKSIELNKSDTLFRYLIYDTFLLINLEHPATAAAF